MIWRLVYLNWSPNGVSWSEYSRMALRRCTHKDHSFQQCVFMPFIRYGLNGFDSYGYYSIYHEQQVYRLSLYADIQRFGRKDCWKSESATLFQKSRTLSNNHKEIAIIFRKCRKFKNVVKILQKCSNNRKISGNCDILERPKTLNPKKVEKMPEIFGNCWKISNNSRVILNLEELKNIWTNNFRKFIGKVEKSQSSLYVVLSTISTCLNKISSY